MRVAASETEHGHSLVDGGTRSMDAAYLVFR